MRAQHFINTPDADCVFFNLTFFNLTMDVIYSFQTLDNRATGLDCHAKTSQREDLCSFFHLFLILSVRAYGMPSHISSSRLIGTTYMRFIRILTK